MNESNTSTKIMKHETNKQKINNERNPGRADRAVLLTVRKTAVALSTFVFEAEGRKLIFLKNRDEANNTKQKPTV